MKVQGVGPSFVLSCKWRWETTYSDHFLIKNLEIACLEDTHKHRLVTESTDARMSNHALQLTWLKKLKIISLKFD